MPFLGRGQSNRMECSPMYQFSINVRFVAYVVFKTVEK